MSASRVWAQWLRAASAASLGLVFACGLACMSAAAAQSFPTKPAKLVVPFPPGGPLDTTARIIEQKLTESWGQSVIVENKPGAGGNIRCPCIRSGN
jgi:tripartite-type tricarboxylate transporter receptor subunit TctC